MRRLAWITVGIAALIATSVAVAHGFDSKSVKPVSATFTATSASNVRTTSCTGSDGTYATTSGTYTGTATSSDPTLNGPVTIDASSLINTSTGVGTVNGRIHVSVPGGDTVAPFTAIYSNGNITGLAQGYTRSPSFNIVAGSLTAGYTGAGGFTGGSIGGGGSGAINAVEIGSGGCTPTPPPPPDKIAVHGSVSAVSSTSITAAGVTCAVPSNLQGTVANVHVGDRIEMRCIAAGGTNTLDSLSAAHSGDHRHRH